MRVAEEQEALTILGAQSQTYTYLDCIYRQDASRNRWLYDSEEAIFGSIDSADEVLVDELTRFLMMLAPTPENCRIYAPLALGNHVDHQVTHRSARHLHDAGYTVWFYEDYPYVVRDPDGLERMLGQWNERQRWHSEIVELDNTDLTRKIAAIYAYRSQLGVLFGAADVRSALLSFGQQVASAWGKAGYAERLWSLQR